MAKPTRIPAKAAEPSLHPVVQALVVLIDRHGWKERFERAIRSVQAMDIPAVADIRDLDDYLRYVDELLAWAPRERGDSRRIHEKLLKFYFFLDQEPVRALQGSLRPGRRPARLTPLSAWIVAYADAMGAFLDTPESAARVDSFRTDPLFHFDEYMPPPSGYRTFNQFFARHPRPGMRPVAAPGDDAILVAPADSSFVGWWQVGPRSDVRVEESRLSVKGIEWSIHQLLEGSAYADRFKGGIFTHAFLDTFDYHRWHAPVRGRVLEARVLQGRAFLDVRVKAGVEDGKPVNVLGVVDGTGYQFVQTRGLVVIDSPIGLVACLPMGMAQVSSVVITAEEGVTLRKGEELGYFQFGGSDFAMVFERASNVQLIGRPGVHVRQGAWIGSAFPCG